MSGKAENSTEPRAISLQHRIAALTPEQRARFETTVLQESGSWVAPRSPARPARATGGPAPLSLSQQRVWFLEQLNPGTAVYHLPLGVRLSGHLNVLALRRALNQMVERHDILRTTFAEQDGLPVQLVHDPRRLTVPLIEDLLPDVGHDPNRDDLIQEAARADAPQPFDLTRGPLLRTRLLHFSEDDHLLLVTAHHLVTDGWSFSRFFQELAVLYDAAIAGQPSSLPALPMQYADFALRQRDRLHEEALADHIAYWRDRLAAPPAAIDLPTDKRRPAVQSFRGGLHKLAIPSPLVGALQALSQREGNTLFMTLLAAFKVLLLRYTGQSDLVVGSPIAGRNHAETERLIGFFSSSLMFRTDLSGDPTFRELLHRVREVALGAYGHQEVPFEQLIEVMQPERTLSQTQLFQVMFGFHNMPFKRIALTDLTATYQRVDTGKAMFDLSVEFSGDGEEIEGQFEYAADLFEPETITRMAAHFQVLLNWIAADPDRRLSALPLLTPAERQQQLETWNATAAPFPLDATIHGLFAAQADRTPEAVAVIFRNQQVTFRELNARANRLAHRLRELRVEPGTRVGIAVERSVEMVIGVLAVLKAGGAYVPLDLSYPPARLTAIIEAARPPVLLTLGHLIPELPASAATLLLIDGDPTLDDAPDSNPVALVSGDDVAYVVFTSCSTGRPQGIEGLHRGAVNRCHWMWEAFPFEDGEVCCHTSSLSFVDSIWELFGSLLQGVPTVILPDGVRADPPRFAATLAAHDISRVTVVPSLLAAMLNAGINPGRDLPRLKYWTIGAEPLPPDLVERFYQRAPAAVLMNIYGSSELSADATCYEVPREAAALPRVPIGRPIANTRLYVLDARLQPVPIGVAGELYAGGAGLSRGYLDQPVLTAERFIPDSFGTEPGSRLFRTGDLARYRHDGTVEYMGRVDRQVQIRGFRVEPGRSKPRSAAKRVFATRSSLPAPGSGATRSWSRTMFWTGRDRC